MKRQSKTETARAYRINGSSRRYSRQLPEVRRAAIVQAAIRCLDKGGASHLTTTSVMNEAKVSRGLVNHYFPSMSDLLVEAYAAMIDGLSDKALGDMRRQSGSAGLKLRAMVDVAFGPLIFEHPNNQAWLEVWPIMTTEVKLREVHTRSYRKYRRELVTVLKRLASERGRNINATRLATATIALVDGLWLNWSIDPQLFKAKEARRACFDMLEAHLGPI